MADTKISAMTAATSCLNADVVPIVSASANFKCTRTLLLTAGAGEDIVVTAATGQAAAIFEPDQLSQWSVNNGAAEGFAAAQIVLETVGGGVGNLVQLNSTGALHKFIDGQIFRVEPASGGGQIVLDDGTDTFTVSGFTFVNIQFTGNSTPYQISGPADVMTALDRIAAAVNGLLGGGGIP